MKKYLIDTDICIFLLKDKYDLKAKVKTVGIENCFISDITIAELTFGAFKSTNYQKHIAEVDTFSSLK